MTTKLHARFVLPLLLILTSLASAPLALAQAAASPAGHQLEQWALNWTLWHGPGIAIAMAKADNAPAFISVGKLEYDSHTDMVTPDTVWRMYSMTKPITALAAIAAIEDSYLQLDEPINKYIPQFATLRVLDRDTSGRIKLGSDGKALSHPATRWITVRHLLTHTAGLGYSLLAYNDDPQMTQLDKGYYEAGLNPFQIDRLTELLPQFINRPATLQDFAAALARQPLRFEPGTVWAYSEGLDLLAAVIEKAVGQPYDVYLQRRLFAKMGVTAYWKLPNNSRLATMYAKDANPLIHLPIDPRDDSQWLQAPRFPYGGAGLAMSARDYDKVLRMLLGKGMLDGVRVLKPESVATAMSNLLPAGVDITRLQAELELNIDLGFGAGGYILLQSLPDGRAKGTYGWGGAASTTFWVDPVNQVRATAMVNRLGEASHALAIAIAPLVYHDLGVSACPIKP